jgi:hypothetical protein
LLIDKKTFNEIIRNHEESIKFNSNKIETLMEQKKGLVDKIKSYKEKFKKLEECTKSNSKKIDTLIKHHERVSDKIKSFDDLKTEFLSFFSLYGYSKVLNTKSFFKKIFGLVSFIALAAACLFYVTQNVKDYNENNLVTIIKVKENESLTFPAITLCFHQLIFIPNSTNSTLLTTNISDVLNECFFEIPNNKCSSDDFEYFQVNILRRDNKSYDCYKFNGGKNATGYKAPIRKTSKFGRSTGLTIRANLPKNGLFVYYIGENSVRPTFHELSNIVQPEKLVHIGFRNTIDIKLPEPFSLCKNTIKPGDSYFVKAILDQNITYRKSYCYNLCLQEYAIKRNVSVYNVYYMDKSFNYEVECSRFCPMECTSNTFEIHQNEVEIIGRTNSYYLTANFFFIENKYTEITQLVKITEADLVSNTGGVMGLFLDISFYHVYRFFAYICDIFIG